MHTLKTSRRSLLGGIAAGAALSSLPAPWVRGLRAQQASEIPVGVASPMTGVFAFAGLEGADGGTHYVQWLNERGGIAGRKIRLLVEDTGYQVPQAVAAFNRLTSQNDLHLFLGDSTGFQKTINEELNRRGTILMAGASFASEINDPKTYPLQYMPGPDYSQQVEMLLQHIANAKKGARIAFVHSDTEFGRDPIARGEAKAKSLGLEVAEKVVTPPGSFDVSAEVLKLRRARPEFTIFHGYVLAPIPEFMRQMRQARIETQFMGTFYSSDLGILSQMGEVADGYMGVNAYNYVGQEGAQGEAMDYIRRVNQGKYRSNSYLQSWTNLTLGLEAMRRTLEADKPLTGANLKAALNSIRDFDTGGVIGVPVNVPGNSIPAGRIFRLNAQAKRMEPVSDWIRTA
ncbi:MAG TPA: ABC transporter substrate-binding protein [Azospirillaceae bacterium]|nr:ABC transporter substrate-binding protein [Azospirillaceae bacterium]